MTELKTLRELAANGFPFDVRGFGPVDYLVIGVSMDDGLYAIQDLDDGIVVLKRNDVAEWYLRPKPREWWVVPGTDGFSWIAMRTTPPGKDHALFSGFIHVREVVE